MADKDKAARAAEREDYLARARAVAIRLAGENDKGRVTIDDVRAVCPPPSHLDLLALADMGAAYPAALPAGRAGRRPGGYRGSLGPPVARSSREGQAGVRRVIARLRCCVPFCRRTRGQRKGDVGPWDPNAEWICGPHWQAIPASRRKAYRRALRRAWAAEAAGTRDADGLWTYPSVAALMEHDRAAWAFWRLWRAARRMAIEIAAGIKSPGKPATTEGRPGRHGKARQGHASPPGPRQGEGSRWTRDW